MTNAISDRTQKMAELIQKSLTCDSNTGIGSQEGNTYRTLLKEEGLSEDEARKYKAFDATYAAAGTLAWAKVAEEAFDTNPDLSTASIKLKLLGHDTVEATVSRMKHFEIGTNPPKDVYGHTRTRLRSTVGSNSGEMAAIYASIEDSFTKHFGS